MPSRTLEFVDSFTVATGPPSVDVPSTTPEMQQIRPAGSIASTETPSAGSASEYTVSFKSIAGEQYEFSVIVKSPSNPLEGMTICVFSLYGEPVTVVRKDGHSTTLSRDDAVTSKSDHQASDLERQTPWVDIPRADADGTVAKVTPSGSVICFEVNEITNELTIITAEDLKIYTGEVVRVIANCGSANEGTKSFVTDFNGEFKRADLDRRGTVIMFREVLPRALALKEAMRAIISEKRAEGVPDGAITKQLQPYLSCCKDILSMITAAGERLLAPENVQALSGRQREQANEMMEKVREIDSWILFHFTEDDDLKANTAV